MSQAIFWIGLLVTACGLVSPPFALLAGLVYAIALSQPVHAAHGRIVRILLQASVVGLGFGMNLYEILRVGRSAFFSTAIGITAALTVGFLLGKLIHVGRKSSFLISAGTAICGGSAIAAVGPIAQASDSEMAVSLGTVFILNSIALFLFPMIGVALHMTQTQFGLWSALAIHDTSSVVGATAKFGAVALAVGTTVKLVRALWIVPLSLGTAIRLKSKARIQWPWFILLFCLAALLNTLAPGFKNVFETLSHLGRNGLTAVLFLIGAGLNRSTLKAVGVRPLLHGLALWTIVGATSLALILLNWLHV